MPVFFVDDTKHPHDLLGFKYLTHLTKLKHDFDFYHVEGDVKEIKKNYKLSKLPVLLVFKEIKVDNKKQIRAAPFSDSFTLKNMKQFLEGIIKASEHHDNVRNRHVSHVHAYTYNSDPNLNHCWKSYCLIIFDSPHLRK